MVRWYVSALVVAALSLFASASWAQEVGSIVAIDGTVEIGRAGTWTGATTGIAVFQHDELRTGKPGRARVIFQDDSVLNVGDDSRLVIDEQLFEPRQGMFRSVFRLLQGKVRSVVSNYYQQPHAEYRIDTPTAVSGVRGTEFVITFDPVADVTEVVGVDDRVEVHGVIDLVQHGTFVTAHEFTSVTRGQFPTPARRLDDAIFRQYLEGLDFIGGGAAESTTINNSILAGAAVLPGSGPEAFPGPAPAALAPALSSYESREADAVDQPRSVLQAIKNNRGDLGVRF